jgi:uroporphyrinogen decarboxylase
MDPCVLYASPEVIKAEAKKVMSGFGEGNGHVFNLGHGIHQHIDPENVTVLVDAVHEFGAK